MKRKNKIEELILNIYRELYKASTPQADFDKLMSEAAFNERGEKEIPFMDYEIEEDRMERIVEYMLSRKSCGMILKGYEKRGIRFNVYLGCSPKTTV